MNKKLILASNDPKSSLEAVGGNRGWLAKLAAADFPVLGIPHPKISNLSTRTISSPASGSHILNT
ncbi:MAG: hypothetical protein JJE12_02670 [Anaerolineales bacterium]|nr:hypothetical protein [Anaerolineales bacterium]